MQPLLRYLCFILSIHLLTTFTISTNAYTPPSVVKIGAVLPLTGTLSGGGNRAWLILNQSLADLSLNLPTALPNTTFELVVADSGSSAGGTTRAVLQLAAAGVTGLIGGFEGLNLEAGSDASLNTNSTNLLGGVGVGVGILDTSIFSLTASSLPEPLVSMVVSHSACSVQGTFSDRTLYPHLFRLCTRASVRATAVSKFLSDHKWERLVIFAQDGNDGYGTSSESLADPIGDTLGPGQGQADAVLSALRTAGASNDHLLRIRLPAVTELAAEAIPGALQQIKDSGLRIILLYLQGDELIQTLRLAYSMGMLQPPYVWIGGDSNSGPSSTSGSGTGSVASGGSGPGLCSASTLTALADLTPVIPSIATASSDIISTYQVSDVGVTSNSASFIYLNDLSFSSSPLLGAICLTPATPKTMKVSTLKYKLRDRGLPFESILNQADIEAYDSIIVYASAIDAMIKAQVNQTASGIWSVTDIYPALKKVSLPTQALTPGTKFDSNGDRITSIDVWNYDPYGADVGAFVRRGYYQQATTNFTFTDTIIWSDGTRNVPLDHEDRFTVGQLLTPKRDSGLMALSYFFVLLPSMVFVYNSRKMIRSFMESYLSTQALATGLGDDKTWMADGLRAFSLFSLPGIFSMMWINLLALTFDTGTYVIDKSAFISGIFLTLLCTIFILFTPILFEIWLAVRRGNSVATSSTRANDCWEDYELHLDNTSEENTVTPAGPPSPVKGGKISPTNKVEKLSVGATGDEKDSVQALALAAKEKLREEKLARRKKRYAHMNQVGFLERECMIIWEKTTFGLALSSCLFATLVSGLFYQTLPALIMPVHIETNSGRAFGVWFLEVIIFHTCLVRTFKDARSLGRLFGCFTLSLALFVSFHANLSCLTFTYTGEVSTNTNTLDSTGIAIGLAILFSIPFFTGLLQLIKALKLSRHSLDAVLNNMKTKLALLESSLEVAKGERKAAANDVEHFKRLLELYNLCRPLHRNHALAFTMTENTGTSSAEHTIANLNKSFIPASLMQEMKSGASQGINLANSRGLTRGNTVVARSSPGTPQHESPNVSMLGDVSPSGLPGLALPIQASPTGSANVSKRAPTVSTGLVNNLTGLDFGFLARPKAELTGYKLLNELSLELFLASGPVHHRAVADIHLTHILAHPLTLELFKDSLTRKDSQETLAFWMDIQRFKQIEDEGVRKTLAESMVATFIYTDAPYPLNFITPTSREHLLNVIFSKKQVRATTFVLVEQELLTFLQKEFASFVTSTGFKVSAFLLGHSSYRPSTRIKTLNPGGAVIGDGGRMVLMTQIENDVGGDQTHMHHHQPMSSFGGGVMSDLSGKAHLLSQHDDPASSVNSNMQQPRPSAFESKAPSAAAGGVGLRPTGLHARAANGSNGGGVTTGGSSPATPLMKPSPVSTPPPSNRQINALGFEVPSSTAVAGTKPPHSRKDSFKLSHPGTAASSGRSSPLPATQNVAALLGNGTTVTSDSNQLEAPPVLVHLTSTGELLDSDGLHAPVSDGEDDEHEVLEDGMDQEKMPLSPNTAQ